MGKYLSITAHSGCEGTAQDSLESVLMGISSGADVIEIDARRDRTGSLIVSHNYRDDYAGCIALETVFEKVAQQKKLRVNCDIKETEIVQDVLALAAYWQLDSNRLILSGSVTPDSLKRDPFIVRRAAVYLNIEEILKEYCIQHIVSESDECAQQQPWDIVRAYQMQLVPYLQPLLQENLALGVQAINLPYSDWAKQYFSEIYTLGIPVSVWTVNSQEDMERLIRANILNLTTLNVRQALGIRRSILGY